MGVFLVIVEFHSRDYLFTCMLFFSEIVLWRNRFIERVELFEEKSILVFPERLEGFRVVVFETLENSSVNN